MKLLLDERANDEQMKFLLDEGMRECQGAALWVYNNAVFSDTDFTDIIKLGGATKEQEINKIGSRSSTNRCFASDVLSASRCTVCYVLAELRAMLQDPKPHHTILLLTGKFGLGFNTVYNVTDVPSFVSRDSIVIFDPHTKHLGRAIRDRSKPGTV